MQPNPRQGAAKGLGQRSMWRIIDVGLRSLAATGPTLYHVFAWRSARRCLILSF